MRSPSSSLNSNRSARNVTPRLRDRNAPYVSPVNVESLALPVLGSPFRPVQATPPVRPLQKPRDETRTLLSVMLPPIARMYGRPSPRSAAGAPSARSQPMMVSGLAAVPRNDRWPPQPTIDANPPLPLSRYSARSPLPPRLSPALVETNTLSSSSASSWGSMTSAPYWTRSAAV